MIHNPNPPARSSEGVPETDIDQVLTCDDPNATTGAPEQPDLLSDLDETSEVLGDPAGWLCGVLKAAGSSYYGGKWQCPAHALDGREHSVSLAVAKSPIDGCALMKCFAGCDVLEVLDALGLPSSSLWVEPRTPPARYARAFLRHLRFPSPRLTRDSDEQDRRRGSRPVGFKVEAIHRYRLRGGTEDVALKVRSRNPETGEKRLRWRSPRSGPVRDDAETVAGLPEGVREADLALYREHEIRPDELVVLCESESSVAALRFGEAKVRATTWAGGAHSPPVDYLAQVLGDHPHVVFIPDNDPAGLASREKIAAALPRVRVVLGEPGEDARDMLNRLGAEALRELLT